MEGFKGLVLHAPHQPPRRLLAWVGILMGLVSFWLGWSVIDAYLTLGRLHKNDAALRDLHGQILRLDEVLTMSARMAAATGDLSWESRYRQFEPMLERAIQEGISLDPGSAESLKKTEASNQKLVAMENKAFDWVREEKVVLARRLLSSPEYEREKANYAMGMKDFLSGLEARAEADLERQRRAALIHMVIVLLIGPLFIIVGTLVWKSITQWESALQEKNDKLAEQTWKVVEQTESLALLNKTLDQKVVDRTKALAQEAGQRRQAEAALQSEKSLLRQVLDTDPNLVFVKDWDGRFILVNKALADIYGADPESMVGKTDADFNPNQTEVEQFLRDDREVITLGRPKLVPEETVTNAKTGEVRWFQTIKVPLVQAGGKARHLLGVGTDITERKKLEAQYLRSQRIESIGALAGGIAHDLNNVLGPVLMALPMLKRSVTDPRMKEFIDIMESSVKRGADMVRQVLAFSRGAKGEKVPLNATGLLLEMEKMLRGTFPKSIQIELTLQETRFLLGDATQVHQTLLNLCVNARDAMPEGGSLTLGAENRELGADAEALHPDAKPGSFVLLWVKDTGGGIPPDVLPKIFDPFFTTKDPGKGTGIGLSTVASIMKAHGGFVTVESISGQGTTFSLYFPSAASAVQGDGGSAEIPHGKGELILVADDESSLREIAKATLLGYGYRVITAADGAEAISLYAQNKGKVAAILLDTSMPVMDGAQAVRALLSMDPKAKIIAMSGLTSEQSAFSGPAFEALAFLQKPYTAERLLKLLHKILVSNGDTCPL